LQKVNPVLSSAKRRADVMNKTLNIQQRNNLITGNHLVTEISASTPDRRAFILIGAYERTSRGADYPSKILNRNLSNTRFWIKTYEVDVSVLETSSSLEEYQTHNFKYKNEIQNIEALEKDLEEKLDDFSHLIVTWKMAVALLD
jgi:sulfur relay (sulfurtransferase) DsrF/TusC family protein